MSQIALITGRISPQQAREIAQQLIEAGHSVELLDQADVPASVEPASEVLVLGMGYPLFARDLEPYPEGYVIREEARGAGWYQRFSGRNGKVPRY